MQESLRAACGPDDVCTAYSRQWSTEDLTAILLLYPGDGLNGINSLSMIGKIIHIEAYLGNMAGLISNKHSKVSIAIKCVVMFLLVENFTFNFLKKSISEAQ